MARVPVVVEAGQQLRPISRERFEPADFEAGGRAVTQGLQRLGSAGQQFAAAQDQLDAALDNAGAKTLDNEFVTSAQAIRTGFLSQQGLNAGTARAATEQSLRELSTSITAKATTPRMRKMLEGVVVPRVSGMLGEFATHVTQQTNAAEDSASLARLGLAGDEAAATTDPVTRQHNIDTGLGEIASRGARLGWSADAVKAEGLKFTSGVHRSILEGMLVADDVDGAVRYRSEHADAMTSSDEQRIDAMLRDPLQRRDTNTYVDGMMGAATGGDTSATFSYSDPLHGVGRAPVPGGRYGATRDYGGHQGVDIPATLGSPVFSAMPGRARVSSSAKGGTTVTVDDGNGNVTRYMHLGKVNIRDGDQVTPDTQIGAVGMTGRSSGPHLHYEVLQGGKHVDPSATAGQVRQSPQRHDLNALLARIDRDPNLTPEQRDRYKLEVERRVGRDEQLLGRAEDDARRTALDTIAKLGPNGFTNLAQLPANVRAGLSPQDRVSFMNMADTNVRQARSEANAATRPNGPDAFNLNMMAIYDPEGFKRLDLGMYQARVTPGELETIAKTQAQMRTAGPGGVDHGKIWGVINRGAPDLGLDLGAKGGKANSPADRTTSMRIFSMVNADLAARTGGQRQPTDDEVQASYDRAVRDVVVRNGDTTTQMRAYQVAPGPASSVPDMDRQQIQAAFARRYRRQPTEGEIARLYAAKPRR